MKTSIHRHTWCEIALCIAISCIVGCASTEKFKKQMDTWLGADINTTMMQWGPPSSQYDMPNGNRQYTWLYVGGTLVTANYNQYLGMVTAGAVTYWCQVSLTVVPSGQIIAWQAKGNSCLAN